MHNTEGRQACIFLSTHSFEPEIIPVQGERSEEHTSELQSR